MKTKIKPQKLLILSSQDYDQTSNSNCLQTGSRRTVHNAMGSGRTNRVPIDLKMSARNQQNSENNLDNTTDENPRQISKMEEQRCRHSSLEEFRRSIDLIN